MFSKINYCYTCRLNSKFNSNKGKYLRIWFLKNSQMATLSAVKLFQTNWKKWGLRTHLSWNQLTRRKITMGSSQKPLVLNKITECSILTMTRIWTAMAVWYFRRRRSKMNSKTWTWQVSVNARNLKWKKARNSHLGNSHPTNVSLMETT